jgi:hypothetical protein
MSSSRSQRGALGALLIALTVVATACGGSSSSAPTTSLTTPAAASGAPSGANRTAFVRYSACLKQHGVTLPARRAGGAPGQGGGAPPTGTTGGQPQPSFFGAGSAKFQKAQAACAKLRPSGAFGGFGGARQSSAAFAAFRNCLTLHGVKATQGTGFGGAPATGKLKKALAACASLRPARPSGTAPSTTPTTTTNQ